MEVTKSKEQEAQRSNCSRRTLLLLCPVFGGSGHLARSKREATRKTILTTGSFNVTPAFGQSNSRIRLTPPSRPSLQCGSGLQIGRELAFAGADSRTREKFRFGQAVHCREGSKAPLAGSFFSAAATPIMSRHANESRHPENLPLRRLQCLESVAHFLDLFSDHLVFCGRHIGRCEQHAAGSPGRIFESFERLE